MAFPFTLLEHFRLPLERGSENVESREFAALIRVASKGVYAGGGSIAEAGDKRKIGRERASDGENAARVTETSLCVFPGKGDQVAVGIGDDECPRSPRLRAQ